MRGKAVCGGVFEPSGGITTAYAGKSRLFRHSPSRFRDHPRLCGEKERLSQYCSAPAGSPPPMRGKDANASKAIADHGITPAYAGKREVFRLSLAVSWDHPRLCGEKSWTNSSSVLMLGSPPPMRGKGSMTTQPQPCFRITPAYAGKSSLSSFSTCRAWDHPRLCGEKSSHVPLDAALTGSPPPMRGKGLYPASALALHGITPAYAGKRSAWWKMCWAV